MTQKKTGSNAPRRKTTSKQVVAMAAIVLLVLLYLATLITALFDNTASHVLFRASLIGTFTIPLLTWVYIWMYGKLTQKHTIADFELPKEQDPARQETKVPEKSEVPEKPGALEKSGALEKPGVPEAPETESEDQGEP